MLVTNLRFELNKKIVELEKAFTQGKPYLELRSIYIQIKELQYELAFAELHLRNTAHEASPGRMVDQFLGE